MTRIMREYGCVGAHTLERIRGRMGDRASRRYLSVLRVGQRAD
jgi:hypothetical protein